MWVSHRPIHVCHRNWLDELLNFVIVGFFSNEDPNLGAFFLVFELFDECLCDQDDITFSEWVMLAFGALIFMVW